MPWLSNVALLFQAVLTPVLPYFLETDGLQKCIGGLPDQHTVVALGHAEADNMRVILEAEMVPGLYLQWKGQLFLRALFCMVQNINFFKTSSHGRKKVFPTENTKTFR